MPASILALAVIRVVQRKEKLVAIGVRDLNHVITPPRFLTRNRARQELAAKLVDPVQRELHEEAAFVPSLRIFTEDDFALPTINLANCPLTLVGMPLLFETQFVDVKAERD
jgi:hypothetical protein